MLGVPPLDLILSETLCQEVARLQMNDATFPLLTLNNLAENEKFLTSNIKSPLHHILWTLIDLEFNPSNIENLPVASRPDRRQPTIHPVPTIHKKKKRLV